MSTIDDGGPAFPVPTLDAQRGEINYPPHVRGMSLRDYFAAAALTGTLSACKDMNDAGLCNIHFAEAARDSYRYADAMLAARQPKESRP